MKKNDEKVRQKKARRTDEAEAAVESSRVRPTRRQFLGGMSAVTAAAWAAGAAGLSPLLGSKATQADAAECAPFASSPSTRITAFQNIRDNATNAAAAVEATVFPHPTNGDEELYATQNFLGNFSKSMPHDPTSGLVVPSAYQALLTACAAGTKAAFDAVPVGATPNVPFVGPLDGLTFNIEGPDSPGLTSVIPPAVASAGMAAQMVELYWEAFCRDVPFIDFASNPLIAQAVTDISNLSAFAGPTPVTPQTIFRYNFADALIGPYVSQILFQTHRLDGVDFVPKIHTRAQVSDPLTGQVLPNGGFDFMTNVGEYIFIENGNPATSANTFDPTPRFVRSIRDLGQLAGSDAIYSIYFRAALILFFLGVPLNPGNPFNGDTRQVPFGTLGFAHLLNLIGATEKAERHTFYHKWNVHRYLRPEAMGNLVDAVMTKRLPFKLTLDRDLLRSAVLPLIFTYNQQLNNRRGFGNVGSFLLPQEFPGGSPTHPSAPAGHAISAGAGVTMLKVWFDTSKPWPVAPVVASQDGLSLVPTGDTGLTVLGELNKLAFNISEGRNMSSIHWRVADDISGMLQGEELVIRILNEAGPTYPVKFPGFTLTKFDGTTVTVGGNP